MLFGQLLDIDMPDLLQSSSLAPSLSDQFESEWNAAQSKAQQAVSDGYSQEDASQMYLQPVRAKWRILQSSPSLLNNPKLRGKFDEEFDASTAQFQKNLQSYNKDGGGWAFEQSLQPTLQKWGTESQMPGVSSKIPEAARLRYQSAVHERDILLNKSTLSDAQQKELEQSQATIAQFENGLLTVGAAAGQSTSTPTAPTPTPSIGNAPAPITPGAPTKQPVDYYSILAGQSTGVQPTLSATAGVNPTFRFSESNQPSAPIASTADPNQRKPLIYIAGSPENSNATLEEANARWAQDNPGSGLQPTTSNTASEYRTANDVKAAFKSGQLDKKTAIRILQEQFGLQ